MKSLDEILKSVIDGSYIDVEEVEKEITELILGAVSEKDKEAAESGGSVDWYSWGAGYNAALEDFLANLSKIGIK